MLPILIPLAAALIFLVILAAPLLGRFNDNRRANDFRAAPRRRRAF